MCNLLYEISIQYINKKFIVAKEVRGQEVKRRMIYLLLGVLYGPSLECSGQNWGLFKNQNRSYMAGEIIDIPAQNNFQISYTYCTIVLTVLYIQTGRFGLRPYQFIKKNVE